MRTFSLSLPFFAALVALLTTGLSLTASDSCADSRWDLNDVTVIMPLPKAATLPLYLRAPSSSENGSSLIPHSVFTQAVRLIAPAVKQTRINEHYDSLTALAFRIDPCFKNLPAEPCKKELRVVWQPVLNGVALDAAAHTFYEPTDSEFRVLTAEFRELKDSTTASDHPMPLQIHPGIAKLGLQNPAVQNFLRKMKSRMSFPRLRKITFLVLNAPGNNWSFLSYRVSEDGELHQNSIAITGQSFESFQNQAGPREYLSTDVAVGESKPGTDQILSLIRNSRNPDLKERPKLIQIYQSTLRLQNPATHQPGTMDCLSCHGSQSARFWAGNQMSAAERQQVASDAYPKTGGFDWRNISPDQQNTIVFRMVGYFGKTLALNSRVIFESAEVAKRLNGGSF